MTAKHKRGPIIAVDGPSGVGKTTISKLIAERLNLRYINTGAMYRALALAADDAGVDLHSEEALQKFCSKATIAYGPGGEVFFNGKDYTPRIRTRRAGELASIASAKSPVREFLVAFQRYLGSSGSVVMEGRDIGTVVFPDADIKFFLDAPHEIRAARRHLEVKEKENASSRQVSTELKERDRRDTERENSPLKMAGDAVYVDTGSIGVEDVVEKILKILDGRGLSAAR